jgi:RNA polymerase sigma-70 factor, ECF subfamily
MGPEDATLHKATAATTGASPHGALPTPQGLGRDSDEELMRRAQGGDKQAFGLVYERYASAILSYLYRLLGNVEDVEAIGQEVFLRAWKFAPTYKYPQKLSTWLFTIARNLAINSAQRRKRNPVRNQSQLSIVGADQTSDPLDVAAATNNDAETREQIARVLSALDGLPPEQKEVIVMGIFQDLTYAEMEDVTGAKAVTLRSRMFHGLRRLAAMLTAEKSGDRAGEVRRGG